MTNPHLDATVEALADVLTVKGEADTLISVQTLTQALVTLGLPVCVKAMEAQAAGNLETAAMYNGMGNVVELLIHTADLLVARDELERM